MFIDYAARLLRGLPHLDADEHLFFATAESCRTQHGQSLGRMNPRRYNPIIWIVNHERELPSWFIAGNDGVRRIAVPMPELDDRITAARVLGSGTPSARGRSPCPGGRNCAVRRAHPGLSLRSMIEIVRLAGRVGGRQRSRTPPAATGSASSDNPWSKPFLRERLTTASERPRPPRPRPAAGDPARAVDIIIRSVMGLSGAQPPAHASKPRGVLFFAGPTGCRQDGAGQGAHRARSSATSAPTSAST